MSAKPEGKSKNLLTHFLTIFLEKIIENEEERRLPIYILFLALGVLTILPNSFFFTATDVSVKLFRIFSFWFDLNLIKI